MSAGTLSADQQRFRDAVAAATGLDRTVVTAWIGAESGWGVTKEDHNYLNIGPGRVYRSTEQAAAATASLIGTSDRYAGIRSAVPAGPLAQVKAIGSSAWGTIASSLAAIYGQLAQTPVDTLTATPVAVFDDKLRVPGTGVELPNPLAWLEGQAGDAVSGATGAVVAGVLSFLGPAFELALETGMRLIFTVAGLALVAMGLNRLTGSSLREGYGALNAITGQAGTAAKLAS